MLSELCVPRLTCLMSDRTTSRLVPALVGAGVDGFQVRAKALADRAVARGVDRAVHRGWPVRPARPWSWSTTGVDVALAAGADGVHLGPSDLPVAAARRIAPDLLIGATCRSRADVDGSGEDGADYAGFGPVFASGQQGGSSRSARRSER